MYIVAPVNELKADDRDHYTSIFVTDDAVKAEDYAKRRAAKNFGITEQIVFKQVSVTQTAMPSEVTVTVNA
jgi:hypothetical protein